MESLSDRARAAAVEVELERTATDTQRRADDETRHRAIAVEAVAAWLADHRLDYAWTLGPATEHGPGWWFVTVDFVGPTPDDDTALTLSVRTSHLHPDTGPDLGWYIARECAACRETVITPAGWALADLGRALGRPLDHRCAHGTGALVLEKHAHAGEGLPAGIAERMAELEADGYHVTLHATESWIIVEARREIDDYLAVF